MKITVLFFLFLGSLTYSQLKVGDLLKDKYSNYQYILDMPYIPLDPQPTTYDIYNMSLSDILKDKNKFTYTSKLKKEALLNRISTVLNNNSGFSKVIIKDDGKTNFVINADIVSDFTSAFAGYGYLKKSFSEIKIRIKDFAYQIEVTSFKVGKDEWSTDSYKSIINDEKREFESQSIGSLFKKEKQQNWNSTFKDYEDKFSKFNNLINDSNDF